MSDEHRGTILEQANKIVLGGLASLLLTSIGALYLVPRDMEASFLEHSRRLDAIHQQAEAVNALVTETSPAIQRSASRILQAASALDFHRTPTSIDRKSADHWHVTSAKARMSASGDLSILAKFASGLPPEGETLRRQIEATLRAELTVWEAIDRFVERKATNQNDEESFAALDRALDCLPPVAGDSRQCALGSGCTVLLEWPRRQ